jgi:hypothetical protein
MTNDRFPPVPVIQIDGDRGRQNGLIAVDNHEQRCPKAG